MFCALLRQFFNDTHDAAKAGIDLLLHDGTSVKVFVEFGMMLADEAALHSVYQCKGASGLKPCALCSNIFNRRTARDVVARDSTGVARYHTCFDVNGIHLHTSDSLRAVARRLSTAAAAGMAARNFAELETRLGFNFVPNGVMQDDELRAMADPTAHLLYDTMHVYYVNGIFNNHVGRLMEALKPHGITYAVLATYVAHWNWPSRVKNKTGKDAVAGKRAESSWKDGVFKCTASEALSLMPVLAQFVDAAVMGSASEDARRHGACFLLLATAMELLEGSARGKATPAELQRAIIAHLNAYKTLYGEDWMPIKFHLSIHFPMFLQRWGILPNCFVLERKHRMPKRYANEMRNTSSNWEANVLRECTAHHFAEFENNGPNHFQGAACLVNPCTPKANARQKLIDELGIIAHDVAVTTSSTARINEWEICSKGDVVLVAPQAAEQFVGQIQCFVALQHEGVDAVFAGIRRWARLAAGARCSKWRRSDNLVIVAVDEISGSLIWAEAGGVVSVISNSRL